MKAIVDFILSLALGSLLMFATTVCVLGVIAVIKLIYREIVRW